MPLQCNIDSKGRLVRLIYGVVLVLVGVILLASWARPSQTVVPWIVSIALMLAGAFAIFEAKAAWCVVRAMGIKTWI